MGHKPQDVCRSHWREKHKAFNHRGSRLLQEKKSYFLIKMNQSWTRWTRAVKGQVQEKDQWICLAQRPGPEQMIWATSTKISAGSGCVDKIRSAVQRQKATESPHRGSHRTPTPRRNLVRRTLGGTGWWEKHKNSREERGTEGKYSEDFRKLATIKASNTDSIELCWWCKDSSIAMIKVASWSFPHRGNVHTT